MSTHWKLQVIKRLGWLPTQPQIQISKEISGRSVILGTVHHDIYYALVEVAQFFDPGDVVETPEGTYYCQIPAGAMSRN